MNQAKMAFISEVLSRHGQQLQHKIIASITSEGLSDPSGGISLYLSPGGAQPSFRITLPVLRRFQDMGAPLQKNRLQPENILANGEAYRGKRHRKFPVYNKNVWGSLNDLSRDLMYGMKEEVISTLQNNLQR